METADQGTLPFLDIKVYTSQYSKAEFVHYRKPTATTRSINFHSYQDKTYAIATLKNEVRRVYAHTTNKNLLVKEFRYITNKFLENGFPLHLILKYANPNWTSLDKPAKKPLPSNKIYLPYIQEVTSKLKTALRPLDYQVISIGHPSLKNRLTTKQADTANIFNESNVIYQIPCADCPKIYIGQTKQQLKSRLASHKSEYKHHNENNSLVQHYKMTGHQPNLNGTIILDHIQPYRSRLNLEAIRIQLQKNKVCLLYTSPSPRD